MKISVVLSFALLFTVFALTQSKNSKDKKGNYDKQNGNGKQNGNDKENDNGWQIGKWKASTIFCDGSLMR
jgi:hypothetical protein